MTHLYTILTRGTVLPARDDAAVTAIAWAGDTVIGLGTDDEVLGLSRGDSRFIDLDGACVIPLGAGNAVWPPVETLELGGRADLAVVRLDPRSQAMTALRPAVLALVRGGRVVAGRLPGDTGRTPSDHDHDHEHQDPA